MLRIKDFQTGQSFLKSITLLIILTLLNACGGSSSSFTDENITAITIDPINGVDGGDGEGEGGGSGGIDPITGGSLTPEELAELPQINIDRRRFADPNVLVPITATVETSNQDAVISSFLWQQISGPTVEIANPTRLNIQVFSPNVDEETQILLRLTVQDSDGRINAATTAIIVQPNIQIGSVLGGFAAENDAEAMFTFQLTQPSTEDLVIEYATQDGTALAGVDYESTIGSATLSAGDVQINISVPLLNSDIDVDTKAFFLLFNVPTGEGNATNTVTGTILIRNEETLALSAPALVNLPDQTIELGVTLAPLVFPNSEGDQVFLCRATPNLPDGLFVRVSEGAASCEIYGLPSSQIESTDYLIVATNPQGISTASINIAIDENVQNLPAPIISNLPNQTFIVNESVSITFQNTGGQEISSCEFAAEAIVPDGLMIQPDPEGVSCVISGTPTEIQDSIIYDVSIGNRTGTVIASVDIAIVDLVAVTEAPDLESFDLWLLDSGGETQEPIPLPNRGGGSITRCSTFNNGRPIDTLSIMGLQITPTDDRSSCQFVGAYIDSNRAKIDVVAENAAGTSEASIEIDGRPFLSRLDVAPQGLLINQPVNIRFGTDQQAYYTACGVEPALPSGLQVILSDDPEVFNTCVITGSPTELMEFQEYVFTAENPIGTAAVTVSLSVTDEVNPPIISDITQTQSLTVSFDEFITPIVITNTGGLDVFRCESSPSLPSGLIVAPDTNRRNCEITGRQNLESDLIFYEITATNAVGSDTATLNIEVTPAIAIAAPNLLPINPVALELDVDIEALIITNDGGVASCSITPALPDGLTLSDNEQGCSITGTPSALQSATLHTITATNDSGSDTGTISLEIIQSLFGPDLFGFDEDLYFIRTENIPVTSFVNNGGFELTNCETDTVLPSGLILQQNTTSTTCEIIGAPTEITALSTHRITATNRTASDTASINIAVYDLPSMLSDAIISLKTNEELAPFETVLDSGAPDAEIISCNVDIALPLGLLYEVNDDKNGCTLFGSTDLPSSDITYILTASNLAGSSSTAITIVVDEAVPVPESIDLSYELFTTGLALNMTITEGNVVIDWGNGDNPTELTAPATGTVRSPTTLDTIGTVTLTFSNGLETITSLFVSDDFDFELSALEAMVNLEEFTTDSRLTGNLSSLSQMTKLRILTIETGSDEPIIGELASLPQSLTTLDLGINVLLGGDISDMGSSLTSLTIDSGTIGGDISDLSSTNTVLQRFTVNGNNEITGDITGIPDSVTLFTLGGNNTVFGDIVDLNESITNLTVNGENTLSGNINDFSEAIRFIAVDGLNEISGDLANLKPNIFTFQLIGSNTVFGDIQNMPASIAEFDVRGANIIAGDLELLTNNGLRILRVYGFNNIRFDSEIIAWMPSGPLVLDFQEGGNSGFSSASLDSLLIHLSTSLAPLAFGESEISISRINDLGRSPQSDNAVSALENNGYTVSTKLPNPVSQIPTIRTSGDFSLGFPGSQIMDGQTSTLWISDENITQAWVEFSFDDDSVCVDSYSIHFSNGPDLTTRAPRVFDFQARLSDEDPWLTLASQSNETNWQAVELRNYSANNFQFYNQYRLLITDDNDDRVGGTGNIIVVSIGEFILNECQIFANDS